MITDCTCELKFSIEPHGDGYALYFGRCNHRHGLNLLHITELSYNAGDILKKIENSLNKHIDEVIND